MLAMVCAIQDQVNATRVYEAKIMKKSVATLPCRACRQAEEKIVHACSALTPVYFLFVLSYKFCTGIYHKCTSCHCHHDHGTPIHPCQSVRT